jgi:hypothetical protein
MTNLKLKNSTPDGLISEVDLGDFKSSWVGEYVPGQGMAVGADNGEIMLIDKDGKALRTTSELDEAINALAFLPGWIGVSTRSEIQFVAMQRGECVPVRYGAHGVIAGPDGHFLAPLGSVGLLFFKPMKGDKLPVVIRRPRRDQLYFYRVVALTKSSGQHIIAAATRKDGIAAMPFDSPAHGLRTLTFESLDAIDLCSLQEGTLSVAVLGKDGTIMICRDVVEETARKQASMTTRFADIKGTAYRLLYSMGNLIVVTSQAIYCLGGLVANFLHGKTDLVTIQEFPIKAIDANVVDEKWLMVVTSRGVLRLDLRKLEANEKRENGHVQRATVPTILSPAWQGRQVVQSVVR